MQNLAILLSFIRSYSINITPRLLKMKLTDFKFEIDHFNVPDQPVEPRDAAKLMVLNREDRTIKHEKFSDIHKYLNKGDVVVYNNTKVLPTKLKGKIEKKNAEHEIIFMREMQHNTLA